MPGTMTLIEKTVFLKSMEMLASIPTEALAQLAARAVEIHADAGEILFREGEEDRGMFVVIEGAIELRKDGVPVRTVRPESAYGEFFLEEEGHQYTGIATDETHLLNLRHDDVVEVLLDSPEFGLAMVRTHALRLHRLTERLLKVEAQLERCEAALKRAGIPPPPDPDDRTGPGN